MANPTPKKFLIEKVSTAAQARQCVGQHGKLLWVSNNKTLYLWDDLSYFTDDGTTCISTAFGNDAGRFHGIAGEYNFYSGGPNSDRKIIAVLAGTVAITPSRAYLYRCNSLFAAVNVTLNPGSAYDGMEIVFKKVGGVFPVNITLSGGATIDGQSGWILADPFEALHLVFDLDVRRLESNRLCRKHLERRRR